MNRIKHPEARECEVFLGNVSPAHFERMKNFTTKRLGIEAMDQVDGVKIPESWGLRPVFVQDWEDELCHLSVDA